MDELTSQRAYDELAKRAVFDGPAADWPTAVEAVEVAVQRSAELSREAVLYYVENGEAIQTLAEQARAIGAAALEAARLIEIASQRVDSADVVGNQRRRFQDLLVSSAASFPSGEDTASYRAGLLLGRISKYLGEAHALVQKADVIEQGWGVNQLLEAAGMSYLLADLILSPESSATS